MADYPTRAGGVIDMAIAARDIHRQKTIEKEAQDETRRVNTLNSQAHARVRGAVSWEVGVPPYVNRVTPKIVIIPPDPDAIGDLPGRMFVQEVTGMVFAVVDGELTVCYQAAPKEPSGLLAERLWLAGWCPQHGLVSFTSHGEFTGLASLGEAVVQWRLRVLRCPQAPVLGLDTDMDDCEVSPVPPAELMPTRES